MNPIDAIFYLAILIMSIVIHEVSHGFMAEKWGDNTARYAGRLTLNPIKHLDMFGSILLPALLFFMQAPFLFGWAKPVPYNPDNLRNIKWGTVAVASAGVLANLFIAIIFAVLLRLIPVFGLPEGLYTIGSLIVFVNLALAVFNLVPIPPLDGSKILFSFLPASMRQVEDFMEQYAFVFLIVFLIYFSKFLGPIVYGGYRLLTGLAF
jgi:Zn-dependent protease